jgi:curved DNA-binding protein CbpA
MYRRATNCVALLGLVTSCSAAVADPWSVLGLQREANEIEVKRAFRTVALEQHPDKGGDVETFIKARAAFEELTGRREFWEQHTAGEGDHSFRAEFEEAWAKALRRVRSTLADGSYWEMAEEELLQGREDLSALLRKQFSGEGVKVSFRRADGSEIALSDEGKVRFRASSAAEEASPHSGTFPPGKRAASNAVPNGSTATAAATESPRALFCPRARQSAHRVGLHRGTRNRLVFGAADDV